MRPLLLLPLVLSAVLFAACEGARVPAEPAQREYPPFPYDPGPPMPHGNPAPNEPPVATVRTAGPANAGYATTIHVSATDPDDIVLAARVDFGDGSPVHALVLPPGDAVTLSYTYNAPGDYRVSVEVTDPRGAADTAAADTAVLGRKVLFVQGYGSRSNCSGGSFANKVEAWAPKLLDALAVSSRDDILYGSYSGRWCDGGDGANGAMADYSRGDTCGGIDDPGGLAQRLRGQVEAAAPAKVTIVGHSMGGLAAAYLVGSDPDWAREHITSVVTFDSPLKGVPQVNLTALRVGGSCSFNSKSTQDLSDTNGDLLAVAATAAHHVPFYNLNASDREGLLFFDVRQAVPGDRTHLEGEALHWTLDASHNDLWSNAPLDDELGPVVQQAVACAIELVPAVRCERPGGET